MRRTTVLTARAQAALVEWADRWRDAARAAVEADAAEDEALRGPHDPGEEFARAVGAEERYEAARQAREEAWAAALALPMRDMPELARDYALARARAEDLWVDAAVTLEDMQVAAMRRPDRVTRSAPEGVGEPWQRVARAARAALAATCVPSRQVGDEDYARLMDELEEAREELAEACDALQGPPPEGAALTGRHPAWELKRLRAEADAASEREAGLAAELAAWVGDNLGPPPGRLN